MLTNTDTQKHYRRQRALASGPAADARRLRDAVLHREQQRRYRAWIVASARTHALDKLTPADTTANSRTCTGTRLPREPQTRPQSLKPVTVLPPFVNASPTGLRRPRLSFTLPSSIPSHPPLRPHGSRHPPSNPFSHASPSPRRTAQQSQRSPPCPTDRYRASPLACARR